MQIEFKHSIKIRVRYGETDQMGYCYYGNYAQYFEVGRVEALREFGMNYKKMEEQGIMLPVSEFQVKYFIPAKYDDELTIITRIMELNGTRIYFDYEILNDAEKCIATAKTTLVFVSKETRKPIAPPVEFIELMKSYEK